MPFAILRNKLFDAQKNIMSLKYADSYQDLDKTEKHILSAYTGGIASIFLGIIDQIYPSTINLKQAFEQYLLQYGLSPSAINKMNISIDKLNDLSWEFQKNHTEQEKKEIKNQFYKIYKDFEHLNHLFKNFLFEWRESLLLDSVKSVLKEQPENQKHPVIIVMD